MKIVRGLKTPEMKCFMPLRNKADNPGNRNRVIINAVYETAMFRFKTLFGDKLSTRIFESQGAEALIRTRH
jgi:hypothetical protein